MAALPWITTIICLLGAIGEIILAYTSSASVGPDDIIVTLFVIGPYLILTSVAWPIRKNARMSVVLLVASVLLVGWGSYLFAEDSYRYHTEPHYRHIQRMTACFVPVVQWGAILIVGVILFFMWLVSRPNR